MHSVQSARSLCAVWAVWVLVTVVLFLFVFVLCVCVHACGSKIPAWSRMSGAAEPPVSDVNSLSQQYHRLIARNEHLRQDIARLRVQADFDRDPNPFAVVGTWRTHDDAVSSIALSRKSVLTCSWDSSLRAFNLGNWSESSTRPPEKEPLFAIATLYERRGMW